jgi:hypothetical protein
MIFTADGPLAADPDPPLELQALRASVAPTVTAAAPIQPVGL